MGHSYHDHCDVEDRSENVREVHSRHGFVDEALRSCLLEDYSGEGSLGRSHYVLLEQRHIQPKIQHHNTLLQRRYLAHLSGGVPENVVADVHHRTVAEDLVLAEDLCAVLVPGRKKASIGLVADMPFASSWRFRRWRGRVCRTE
jgi:hypothetical protein